MQEGMRWKFIYDQINGMLEPDVCQWVRDESSMQEEISPLVEQIYEARNRLCERLGTGLEADEDLDRLVRGFEELSRICGKLMYHYCYLDGVNKIN